MVSYKLFLFVLLYSEVSGLKERISGEEDAQEKFPYVVVTAFLQDNATSNHCSGSLIAPNWVLTTAFCVTWGKRPNTVFAGSYVNSEFDQARNVSRIVIHPKHEQFKIGAYDMALIRTDEPFNMSSGNIGILKLSGEMPDRSRSLKCILIGRGDPKPEPDEVGDYTVKYNYVLAVFEGCRCFRTTSFLIPKNALCLDEIGIACRGDLGGPLVCGGSAVGYLQQIIVGNENWCPSLGRAEQCSDTTENYIMLIYPLLDAITSFVEPLELSTDPLPYLEEKENDEEKKNDEEEKKEEKKKKKKKKKEFRMPEKKEYEIEGEEDNENFDFDSSTNVKSKLSLLTVIVGFLCLIN